MKTIILLLFVLFFFISCTNKNKKCIELKSFTLEKVWTTDTILKTPESAYYDEDRDVIYVSNLYRESDVEGDVGFISKINTNGDVIELEWVTGLNSPKGMAVFNNKLYVSEIDKIAIIDIDKGEIIEKVLFEGAEFLNDISVDSNGMVFISDSKESVIYTWFEGEKSTWIDSGFSRSNGLLCENNRILVAATDFLSIDYETKNISIINDSISGGDGIAEVGCGYYLVSEWPGEVFIIAPDSSIKSVLNTREEKINTADIDYIKKDSLLLVPTFYKNSIDAYKLKEE